MKKKRSTFEVVLISVVVMLSLVLGAGIYAGRATVQKRRLLIQELSMLRSAISLYAVINKQLPPDLVELEKVSIPLKIQPSLIWNICMMMMRICCEIHLATHINTIQFRDGSGLQLRGTLAGDSKN